MRATANFHLIKNLKLCSNYVKFAIAYKMCMFVTEWDCGSDFFDRVSSFLYLIHF